MCCVYFLLNYKIINTSACATYRVFAWSWRGCPKTPFSLGLRPVRTAAGRKGRDMNLDILCNLPCRLTEDEDNQDDHVRQQWQHFITCTNALFFYNNLQLKQHQIFSHKRKKRRKISKSVTSAAWWEPNVCPVANKAPGSRKFSGQ